MSEQSLQANEGILGRVEIRQNKEEKLLACKWDKFKKRENATKKFQPWEGKLRIRMKVRECARAARLLFSAKHGTISSPFSQGPCTMNVQNEPMHDLACVVK